MSEVIDHGFIHSIYTFDPNGIPIEFSYSLDTVDIRKNPQMEDLEPTAAAREGADPQPGQWPEANRPTPAALRRVYPGVGSELFHSKKGTNG